jgi:hypothetical protein
MLRPRWFVLAVAFFAARTISSATETEHFGIQVLSAADKVTVDGRFDDGDLSGGVLACGDVENYRD